jgi:catechol 2,3-dioxygenase-like lactoylglutathione lyase family enzyme
VHDQQGWPQGTRVGAVRFARRTAQLGVTVAFYRDLVGLPLLLTFDSDDGPDHFAGAVFGLPGTPVTFELVESKAPVPVPVDDHEQLVLYFPGPAERDEAVHRLDAAGQTRAVQYQYWTDNDAVTFRDPDGREVVLAPWVFGEAPPPARHKTPRPAP